MPVPLVQLRAVRLRRLIYRELAMTIPVDGSLAAGIPIASVSRSFFAKTLVKSGNKPELLSAETFGSHLNGGGMEALVDIKLIQLWFMCVAQLSADDY